MIGTGVVVPVFGVVALRTEQNDHADVFAQRRGHGSVTRAKSMSQVMMVTGVVVGASVWRYCSACRSAGSHPPLHRMSE